MPQDTRKFEARKGFVPLPNSPKVGICPIFVGIDIAKHRHELCLVDRTGYTVLQMSIDNSRKGFDKLLKALDNLTLPHKDILFCMEATGHYCLDRYCHLTDLNFYRFPNSNT